METTKTVAINTLGCKVNRYESACIADDFIKNGFKLVPFDNPADIYIINTCTVTNRTDFKSRNAIRRALRKKQDNPSVKVIVTGCYAQLNNQQISELGSVDLVAGNDSKASLYDLLFSLDDDAPTEVITSEFRETTTDIMPERVRAFVKIQDGCDCFCSYCIVPFARGKPRSREPLKVIEQIKRLAAAGYKEFVMAGINLGLYNSTISFSQLLAEIEKIDGVLKIRLSSIEPQLIDNELLSYIAGSQKICPHFHIPLQSGSDGILKKMNRQYNTAEFAALIEQIKSLKPHAAIGTDIISGLPGETESHFEETYSFLKSLPLTYAHIFPYSKRDGTVAARMPGQVPHSVTKNRCRLLADLMENKKQKYIDSLIKNGVVLSGILENEVGFSDNITLSDGQNSLNTDKRSSCLSSYWTALSDHYIRIYLQGCQLKQGDYVSRPASMKTSDGIILDESNSLSCS